MFNKLIILISPYKSVGKILYDSSFMNILPKFDSESKIKTVTCPAQIYHGTNDSIIDYSHGICLYNLFKFNNKGKYKIILLKQVGHNFDVLDYIQSDICS